MKNIALNYSTLLIAVIAIPCFLYFILIAVPIDLYVLIGISLTAVSFVFLIVARLQLGKSFSIAPQASELVTHGLYSKIRHPIYIFGQALVLGIVLSLKSPLFFLVWLVIIFVQYKRAKKEEQVLEEKFGEAYRKYKLRTWF
jgi:protein-S-isoprenylcysteine O-methyltransferase Ste14